MEDGVLFSLDFTDIIEKDKKGMWKWIFNECNYTILLIVFANILTFGIYFKMCRRRMLGENNPRRAQEINQVINEMVRLNNDSNIDDNNNSSNSNNENNNNSNNNNDNLVDESNSNEQQIPENIHQNEQQLLYTKTTIFKQFNF